MADSTRGRSARSELAAAVQRAGGVARVSSLQRAGHSRHYIRQTIQDAVLERVARDWVALPGADPELVGAARAGAVLTCVTQARRLGLWVLREDAVHLGAEAHSRGGKPPAARTHWAVPVVPRHPDALVDPIENVLALVSGCQPHDSALAIWESALRTGLLVRERIERMPLPAVARTLLAEAQDYADSGLETIFTTRLRWLGIPIRAQIWIHGHRIDHLLGDRLVVQIDGAHHVGDQRLADIAHDAQLRLLGYSVFRFGYHQVIDDWPHVQSVIQQAVAQGLHRRR